MALNTYLGFAVPTIAQDQNTIDREVRQQIQALFVKFDDSFNKNDVAAMTSLYTQDAAVVNERLSEGGASVGRSAIEKNVYGRVRIEALQPS